MIDHIVFDVDGTLTDGGLLLSDAGELKRFDVKDGLIIAALPKLGYTTIFLTGRRSDVTSLRAAELGISLVVQGVSDKAAVLRTIFDEKGVDGKRFAYIGDDLNDYEAMKLCSFRACPVDAVQEIKELCNYVSYAKAGYGAARDVCEQLLRKQNQFDALFAMQTSFVRPLPHGEFLEVNHIKYM